jgi:nitrate/nitrite-specific signal transduction histidine kinase
MLWSGTHEGLIGANLASGVSKYYVHDPDNPQSLSDDTILAIYEDRAGELWLGTESGGLNRYDRDTETFTSYPYHPDDPSGISNAGVTAIAEDPKGRLWIATPSGLDKFDRETDSFVHFAERDGLENVWIHGMVVDDAGNLWLSTNSGLSRFDPQTETFKNFDVSDGLQSNGFNTGAYYKSASGELLFGGVNGFNAFYPDRIRVNTHIPPIVITAYKKFGETVRTDISEKDEIVLSYRDNFVSFEFAALDYAAPAKNQYAYRLEGFDPDWIDAGTRRYTSYTNLKGGQYTFRVKGSNNDGVWNQEGIAVLITVTPPFWENWWFRASAVIGVIGIVIIAHRLRVRSIAARNRELENQVQERTQEIKERTHETERRRRELEALYRADSELHRHLRLDEVLRALVDIAVDILHADKSALLVWDEQKEELTVRVARGYSNESLAQMRFQPGEGTVGLVAASGKPVIVEDTRTDPRIARRQTLIEPEGIQSFMQVPIKVGDGVLSVFSADYVEPRAFGSDEQRLFTALAQRAALAIDTAQLYEQTQELAVVEERSRLARDLHDAVTQTLFSANLIAEALPSIWQSDQVEGRELLGELQQLSRGALAEMRTLLLELRPASLTEMGLGDLLRQLAQAVTGQTGLPIKVEADGWFSPPADVHVALYRIAQEALNNVAKHAHASEALIRLRRVAVPGDGAAQSEENAIELCVRDDGRGFDPTDIPPDRLGLSIMRERADAIGATLQIESRPGAGTKVAVLWEAVGSI